MPGWLWHSKYLNACFQTGISQFVLHQTQISKLYLIWRQLHDTRISSVTRKSKHYWIRAGSRRPLQVASASTLKRCCTLSGCGNPPPNVFYFFYFGAFCSFWLTLKSVKMTLRDSSWYRGPDLIYGDSTIKEIWLQLNAGGGGAAVQRNIWGM